MNKLIFNSPEYLAVKNEILNKYGVQSTSNFNSEKEIRGRIDYLKNFIHKTGLNGFVLGISGGVDSTTVGRLCQIACEELRTEGLNAKFYAMRLPAGVQFDETDAQEAMKFINPDVSMLVNVGDASNFIHNAFTFEQNRIDGKNGNPSSLDYHKGNVKARMRMIAQYEVAGYYGLAVVGTSQATELCTAFFSKYGDGGSDLHVINGLNKRQVRLIAKTLGSNSSLWDKAPTADLEELNPGKLDDDGFGFPYESLDDFLEGKTVPPDIEQKIVQLYENTRHKRELIPEYQ